MKKSFMLTFMGSHDNWNKKSEIEWHSLNQKHDEWVKKFSGLGLTGSKLASKGSKILIEKDSVSRVVDGPFTETKEVLTGFYTTKAENMDHAVELAKGCPWLLHDKMEIFEISN